MGLTIHYRLRTTLTEPRDVRDVVVSLQQAAAGLSFQQVGPVKEFRDKEADYEQSGRDDEDRWLKIQAGRYLEVGDRHYKVKPRHIIAFTVDPGLGCEPANFGFCQFPPHIDVPAPGGCIRQVATHLDGWSWKSFCKTQYASDPRCGGIENFVRCHVGLVKLLDFASNSRLMTVEVHDESDYWELRDPKQLVNTVGDWNQFVAAFAGTIKDLAEREGTTVEAAIAGFPNFEHLEAKGLDRLSQSRPNE
jgi:hypothetical protein